MKNLEIQNKEVTVEMSMQSSGRGQYSIIAECRIEKNKHTYKFHSTDSELFDKKHDEEVGYEEWQEMLYNRVDTDLIERIEETIYQEEY